MDPSWACSMIRGKSPTCPCVVAGSYQANRDFQYTEWTNRRIDWTLMKTCMAAWATDITPGRMVALANRLGVPLVTADKKVLKAFSKNGDYIS